MILLIKIYLLVGLLFALLFLVFAYKKIDPSAEGASLPVRLMWAPGAAALWPILVVRWLQRAQTTQT